MTKIVKLRVREGCSSVDAQPFAFILGSARKFGNVWEDRTLTAGQIETLRNAGIFEFFDDPPTRRLVRLGGREVDLTGRRRVVMRAAWASKSVE